MTLHPPDAPLTQSATSYVPSLQSPESRKAVGWDPFPMKTALEAAIALADRGPQRNSPDAISWLTDAVGMLPHCQDAESAWEAAIRILNESRLEEKARADKWKSNSVQLAAGLADLYGYVSSLRTDRQIKRDGDTFVLQTLEWADGLTQYAGNAVHALDCHDLLMENLPKQ